MTNELTENKLNAATERQIGCNA